MLPLLQPSRPKLPPSHRNVPTASASASAGPVYNCAYRHPVFFTCALRKPPFALPQPHSHGETMNPVAHGYIAENQTRTKQTKL